METKQKTALELEQRATVYRPGDHKGRVGVRFIDRGVEVGTFYAAEHDGVNPHSDLFAAAPDLLEALQELCDDPYLSQPLNNDRMAKARAAIAKATA